MKGLQNYIFLILFYSLLLTSTAFAQNSDKSKTYTISGYITNSKSSETLINASVYDELTMKGSVTNAYGYYTLHLPKGNIKLKASYVGYAPYQSEFMLGNDTVINISLDDSSELLAVEIVGKSIESNVRGTQMGTIELPVQQIKKMPTIFGEADVIKALQLLPGVQSGTEGSAGMYVRGGGPDENLILLDGIPLYNVNHLFGFFSAFNADAIKNVTLYKGNFPARFGGRLSSVIDVRMKDGDMYEYHGNASIGLIAAKLNVEGPIVKGKTSFNISARRTYMDVLTAPIIALVSRSLAEGSAMAGSYFYDLNLKINHKFSDKDRLFLSFYSGDDAAYVKYKPSEGILDYQDYEQTVKGSWKWGNLVAAIRWNHVISPKLFMNITTAYTQYRHKLVFGMDYIEKYMYNGVIQEYSENIDLGLNSGIFDMSAKADFDYKPSENHDIKFGADFTHHLFSPNTVGVHYISSDNQQEISKYDSIVGSNDIKAMEAALFIEDNWTINDFMKTNIGAHFSIFNVNGKTYTSLQPRLSMRFLATDNLSFKAGYAYMSQYIHLLSNNSISLPTDLWVPVTDKIEPMNSHQVAVGAFYDFKEFEFSIEAYYKRMDNVLEYKDGASFFSFESSSWEEKVVMGRGYSYGVEFLVQRTIGKTTGWIGYTWAKTNRIFDREGQELNNGNPFPAKYDRRHDISITASHKFNEAFDMGATFIFSTGNCATLALQEYPRLNINENYDNPEIGYINTRNNYRLGNYLRLDLGFNYHKIKKRGISTWSFSIYNATCHNNPFLVYVGTSAYYDRFTEEYVTVKELKQVSIFPIIPTVSWSFKF